MDMLMFIFLYIVFPDDTVGMADESSSLGASLQKLLAPEVYGFRPVDALHFYATKLQQLNAKVAELQLSTFDSDYYRAQVRSCVYIVI